jgi:hypothetical protein
MNIHESSARDIEEALRIQLERTAAAEEAFQSVTRVKVMQSGKYTEHWADHWLVRVEDGGRTISLCAVGDGARAISERAAELGDWLGTPADTAQEFVQAVAEADGQPNRFDQSRESTKDTQCGD